MTRCSWLTADPLYIHYHDHEWGVPVHDDRHLFEMLILEGAQAGLSWLTVLKKRAHYKQVFHDFEVGKVAAMSDSELEGLLLDAGIIRNRLKVFGARKNALAALKLIEEVGSLDTYFWSWTDGEPLLNHFATLADIPTQTPLSVKISKDLKKRGFTFVGPTIIYAFMQAVGMVNDHTTDCSFRARR